MKDFRFFYQYIRNRFFVLVLLSIIVGLLDGFGISMIVPLLATLDTGESDRTEVDRYQQVLTDALDRLGIEFTLTSIFLVMLLIFTIKSIAVFAESYYGVSVRAAFMRRVRHKLISGVRLQSYKLFRDSDHNKVQNFLTLESARLGSAILFFFAIIRSAFKILVYVSLALLSSFRFSILVALGALLTNLIYRWTFKKTEAISLKLTTENTSLQGLIKEYISSYKYLRTTSNIDMYAAKADQKSGIVEHLYKKMGFLNSLISSTREFFVLSIIIGVLIIEIQVFHSDVPGLIVSLLLFYRGLNAFLSLQTSWNQYLNNAGSVVSIREMLRDFESNKVENSDEEIAFDSSIKIENGSLVYETGSFKIDSINLEIPKNSHVAFVGKSGSGKTTVVDILCGLLLLDKGKLTVDGVELTSDNTRSLSRLISYVGQKPVIFHDSIYNNITLWRGSGDETDKLYWEIVDIVQLGDLINSFDEQSNTVLSDGGVNLSGGQIQRIALARELYQQRDIIILDEATSALDKESELYLKSVIAKLKGAKTIVQISHSYDLIEHADVIYEMKNGRISKFSS